MYLQDKINSIEFVGYNYGQPIPDLSEYDKVIMCDISFPREEMERLYWFNGWDNFIWIDHHISAINDNDSWRNKDIRNIISILGLLDTKFAACELTWKYFFRNEPMPEIVRLLGRYDCFGHKGTDEELKVLEFQYGARQVITDYEDAYEYLLKSIEDIEIKKKGGFTHESRILTNGKTIFGYLCTEAKRIYQTGFEIRLDEFGNIQDRNKISFGGQVRKFICINKERFNPINFGIDYHKDGYDGTACFHYANGKWDFSLYNDNGLVDCSAISKSYGGGGHFSAAGMVIDTSTMLKIIGQ